MQLGEARCSFMHHMHAHTCVHLHARLHTHVHTAHACVHSHMYVCVCLLKPGFSNLAPPPTSLGPKHSSECMVQMVFDLFFGLFASLDRLSVPTAEWSASLQKYEPMWKHSGGKLMGPIPLTQRGTALVGFDLVWFVCLFWLCIWGQSLLIRFYVVSVEKRLFGICIRKQF